MDAVGAEAAFMAAAAGKAFVALLEPHRLMFLMAGCLMGLILGIVPGIGGLAGTAMLLPFTFAMDPYSAFALLLGLGATTATGDPIPAILFGVPGGAASAATVLDGFPMAKKGEAGRALSAAYMSSMMGGIFGAMLLAVSIPILRPVMLYLGSPELLAFSVLGISMVAVLSGSARPPPPAIRFRRSCSACPEVQPPRQRCWTASRWRNGARPAARSAPPTCRR